MIRKTPFHLFWLFIVFNCFNCLGQSLLIPLNHQHNLRLDELIQHKDSIIHTSFKPLIEGKLGKAAGLYDLDSVKYYYDFTQKLFKENLIIIKEDEFEITIDPVFNFSFGQDLNDSVSRNLFRNTRGFQVQGEVGKKIGFYSSFYENQSVEPHYVNSFIDETGVSPGQGRVKSYKDGKGYDYAMASGYISYTPVNLLNLQLGHHKNFVGNGYRSMLWSDNSFNYPFFKSTTSFLNNKLNYTNLFAILQSLKRMPFTNSTEAIFERYGASVNYLSYQPHPKIEIGLFEFMHYGREDTAKVISVPYNFYLPIIGLNTAIFGLDGKNSSSLGLNLHVKPVTNLSFYGQFVAHSATNNNFGYQLGLKLFSPFGIENVYLQAEFNRSESGNAIGNNVYDRFHYNQPLAHPLNKSFAEALMILNYQYGKFFFQLKGIGQQKKASVELDNNNVVVKTQEQDVDVFIVDAQVGIKLNKKTNAQLFLGLLQRNEIWKNYEDNNSRTSYFYISLKTSLINLYYDY